MLCIVSVTTRAVSVLHSLTRCSSRSHISFNSRIHFHNSQLCRSEYKYAFLRSCDRASWQIFWIKPTRSTNFSNLFWNKTLYVSESFSVHHQEFFTVHTAMVYVIQFCRQLSSRIRMELQYGPEVDSASNRNEYQECFLEVKAAGA
jgi:hypothetical protein